MHPVKTQKPKRNIWRLIVGYFFQGVLIIAPIAITIYFVYWLLLFIDRLLPLNIPGLGILLILVFITAVGFLSSTYIFKPIFGALEEILSRLPLVKIVYTSLQDLFSAFVGDKRKFDRPVLVILNRESGIKRLGFITQSDLSMLDAREEVAVYLPHSYNFSGNLYIVPRTNIISLSDINATETMKFIVSGGIADLEVGTTENEVPPTNYNKLDTTDEK